MQVTKARRPRTESGRPRRITNSEWPDFGESPAKKRDGVVCILDSIQNMVDGTLGVRPKTMNKMRFARDTGAGFIIIPRDKLQPGWGTEVDTDAAPSRVRDANGNLLWLEESVWLTVRFRNTLLRVTILVAERIEVK